MPPSFETITWQAHEYNPTEISRDWFIGVAAFGFVILLIALFTKNFLFALLILIATILIILLGAREPELITFSITNKGFVIKNQLYLYRNLIAFGLKDHEQPHKLMIHTTRLLAPHIIIPLEEIDPELIRASLKSFLPEVHFEESLVDLFMEYLGF